MEQIRRSPQTGSFAGVPLVDGKNWKVHSSSSVSGDQNSRNRIFCLAEFIATQVAALVKILKMERQIQVFGGYKTRLHNYRKISSIPSRTSSAVRLDSSKDIPPLFSPGGYGVERKNPEGIPDSIIDQETDNLQDLIGNLLDSARPSIRSTPHGISGSCGWIPS